MSGERADKTSFLNKLQTTNNKLLINMVEERFLEAVEKYELVKRKDKIILGVSGGPDSVCMLHLFCNIKTRFNLNLICAHFNHCLRKEADSEEEFVRDLCKELKIRFVSDKKNVEKFFRGDSLEQTARNLRLDFFLKCARQFKIKKLAVAHNKDDVVETMLMRIIRGTALKGLRGILPKSKFRGVTFIRPLIETRKKEVLKWLSENSVSYRIDKTNFENKFFRNKIRLKLLPLLKQFNPNITGSLFNLSRVTSLDYEFIYNFAREKFNQLKKRQGKDYVKLDLETIKKFSRPIVFNVLRLAIEELKGDTRRLELKHIEQALDLIYRKCPLSKIDLPGLEIRKEDEWLVIGLCRNSL